MRKDSSSVGVLAVTLVLGIAAVLPGSTQALIPSDPEATHPTYASLNLPAAWDLTIGSPRVVIAIVDSGIDPTHPDLIRAVTRGYDFVDRDDNATDPPGAHGTSVAGVAAARANNGFGGMGVCFSCTLMPLRVLGLDGIAFNTNTAAAIDYAVDHGAAVVNVSLYGPNSPQRLRNAIVRARAAGVLVVAAAGNEGSPDPQYPAAFPEAISVGAAAADARLTRYSSFGSWLKFAAPECAPVTAIGGGTEIGCATSVASPLVAGVVALLRAHAPFAMADELEQVLARTARTIPGTRHGLVDAAAALIELGQPGPRLLPAVIGAPVVGDALEAFAGVWSGAGLPVTYQWERCRSSCTPIEAATSSRYTPNELDKGYELRIVASSLETGSATSTLTPPVAERPRFLEPPSIAGRPRVGTRLVANTGSWAGTSLAFAARWLRCRRTCSWAADGARYTVRPRDRGYRLRVDVIASNSFGSASARSKPTSVVR